MAPEHEEIPSGVRFTREICCNLAVAESLEWLVTNGIGGFASGTIATGMTRRYHGLLIAALQPPLGRTQLVAGLDEIVRCAGTTYALATHHWASGAVDPQGYLFLESFRLDGTVPVWTYALADSLLEKRVWMKQGENTTFLQYTLTRDSAPLEMELKALVNYRDFHSLTHAGDWQMKVASVEHGVMILPFDAATPFYLKSPQATCEPRHVWYRDCFLPMERDRGLDDHEDHLFAALFHANLNPGESLTIVASTEATTPLNDVKSLDERINHELALLESCRNRDRKPVEPAPDWIPQLVLAADEFIVKRALPEEPDGQSIIAGYHWFGDWGRDTMIALPGLALMTGRPEAAKRILLAFARYVDGGMLPNNFPDAGGKPGYNSVDAALWYFEAIRQYIALTHDSAVLHTLFPVLASIIDAYHLGTRFNIHVDANDGLLFAGGPGVQLTWMDAKIGEWVVTPRTGKPVEINALWINALRTIANFARLEGKSAAPYESLDADAEASFQRFWNASRNCCFDVIDVPSAGKTVTNDAAIRPNQIFAVSLPVTPLSKEQQKSVVDTCARDLLTRFGLRSLAPGDPNYQGRYLGDQRSRDAAYHQGTVWGWLLGPFALAHYRVYSDRAAALAYLEPLGENIGTYGLGTLPEIFDGDPPHSPRGCIAQAWTVAELLRALSELSAAV